MLHDAGRTAARPLLSPLIFSEDCEGDSDNECAHSRFQSMRKRGWLELKKAGGKPSVMKISETAATLTHSKHALSFGPTPYNWAYLVSSSRFSAGVSGGTSQPAPRM